MELDVSKAFLTPATPFPFEAEVALEPQDVGGETVTFDPVRIEGSFYAADDMVRLEGRLRTVAHGACALCMEQADAPLRWILPRTSARTPTRRRTKSSVMRAKPCRLTTWRSRL